MSQTDPRPDQRPNRPGGPYPDTGESPTKPAPGGAGTGTKNDPAKNVPASQPNPNPGR